MSIRSYVDLAFFVCVLRAGKSDVPPDVRDIIETGSDHDLETLFGSAEHGTSSAYKAAGSAEHGAYSAYKAALWNPDTHLHETIHFWQGLSLPFLYFYSFSAFQTVNRVFVSLDQSFDDLHEWRCPMPGILNLMTEPVYVYVKASDVECFRQDRGDRAGWRRLPGITALDMLESATSLIQWQLSTVPPHSGILHFRRWAKQNPAYPEAVDWLASMLQDKDLAVDLFLPLSNAAFHTMNPVMAFARTSIWYATEYRGDERVPLYKVKQRIEKLIDKLAASLRSTWPIAQAPTFEDPLTSVFDLPFYRFSMEKAIDLTFGKSEWRHPTLYRLAERWLKESQTKREMCTLLDAPSAVSRSTVDCCFAEYQPLLLVHFDLPRRNRVVPLGRISDFDYVSRVEKDTPGVKGIEALFEQYIQFGTVRRATGAFYEPNMRLCHHRDCPEFAFNYCNSWISIPVDHEKCGFRDKLKTIRTSLRNLKEASHEPTINAN